MKKTCVLMNCALGMSGTSSSTKIMARVDSGQEWIPLNTRKSWKLMAGSQ